MFTCFVLAWILIHNFFSPTDWVDVEVRNVPKGLRQFSLVSESAGHVELINPYPSKFGLLAENPLPYQWDSGQPTDSVRGSLQWPWADRYGVVAQRADRSWIIWWLRPSDLDGPPVSRWIWGGTRAEIVLPDASEAISVSKALLDQLELSERAEPR